MCSKYVIWMCVCVCWIQRTLKTLDSQDIDVLGWICSWSIYSIKFLTMTCMHDGPLFDSHFRHISLQTKVIRIYPAIPYISNKYNKFIWNCLFVSFFYLKEIKCQLGKNVKIFAKLDTLSYSHSFICIIIAFLI